MSPTERSLKYLRDAGYTVAKAEHWNPFARRRVDLFGFIDLVAIRPGETLAVQTTSRSNVAARRRKILGLDAALTWLQAGNRIVVHGWDKTGLREIMIGESDFTIAISRAAGAGAGAAVAAGHMGAMQAAGQDRHGP